VRANAVIDPALSVRELARRWRVAPKKIRTLIRRGVLLAFDVGGKRSELRIAPEAVRAAEQGTLAVRPARKPKGRSDIDPAILALLEGRA
jgi:hypothetical protein